MHFPAVFFGTLRDHYLLLFGAAGSVALFAGFIGAWVGSHFAARRASREVVRELSSEMQGGPQFQQIMQAMDVLSVEVERLSEGHRFVAKLLSERAERDRIAALPPRDRKSERITPH
jgi:hypothetical protein